MPSYAETLSEEERWQVAYYVASLGQVNYLKRMKKSDV